MQESIRVLLVEDNEGDARLIEEMLAEASATQFEIVQKPRLSGALQYIDEHKVDVVLLDLSLPDSHGFDTFLGMQQRAEETPIILLTGLDDEKLAVSALKQGAQDYLVKSKLDVNLMVRAIKYAIERHQLLRQMEKARGIEQFLAYHDVLTNLPNRLLFHDRLQQALAHAKRYSGNLAIFFLDLDGFKGVNDTLGHALGDRLLQDVANRLLATTRESDTIARLGGDEFVILLKGVGHIEDVHKVGRKIRNEISRPFLIDGHSIDLTASIGVSMYPDDGTDMESLMKKADFAMYRAKEEGKNKFELFDISRDYRSCHDATLLEQLQMALRKEELTLYFQPQVDLRSGRMVGCEALVRWQHPVLGLIPPADFVGHAEESGLIVPFGEWVIATACRLNKKWQELGLLHIPVSVNLSARQFREIGIVDTIEQALHDTGLSARYLMLEITETSAMKDVDYTIAMLESLKQMGVQIALDDFGTGYSSLSYLKRLPIDLLKIDKSFVVGVPGDAEDASIISAIVGLAHNLGMQVVAEGVEKKDQLHFLRSINCDQMQGYFFSTPLPAQEFISLLERDRQLMLDEVITVVPEVKVV